MFLRLLVLNEQNKVDQPAVNAPDSTKHRSNEDMNEVFTAFGQITRWGTSLLAKVNATGARDSASNSEPPVTSRQRDEGSKHTSVEEKKQTSMRQGSNNQSQQTFSHIYYKVQELDKAGPCSSQTSLQSSKQNTHLIMDRPSFGMASRMALISSACQGGQGNSTSSVTDRKSYEKKNIHYQRSEPIDSSRNIQGHIGIASRMALISSSCLGEQKNNRISSITEQKSNQMQNKFKTLSEIVGALPKVESNVSPDLKTFTVIINGKPSSLNQNLCFLE